MSSTRCVLDVSTSRFVLLLGSCASSWRAPRASSWRAPRERASMKNDGMMIIIIGARGRVFGFATKPSTSLAVARRPVHSRVPTRLTSQPAHAAVYTIYFYSDFIQFDSYTVLGRYIFLYPYPPRVGPRPSMQCLLLGTLALCRTRYCYNAEQAIMQGGGGSAWNVDRQGLNLKFNLAAPSAAATRCQRSCLALRESSAPLLAHEPVAHYRAHTTA